MSIATLDYLIAICVPSTPYICIIFSPLPVCNFNPLNLEDVPTNCIYTSEMLIVCYQSCLHATSSYILPYPMLTQLYHNCMYHTNYSSSYFVMLMILSWCWSCCMHDIVRKSMIVTDPTHATCLLPTWLKFSSPSLTACSLPICNLCANVQCKLTLPLCNQAGRYVDLVLHQPIVVLLVIA